MTRKKQTEVGMSLVEILVAVAVASLMFLAMSNIISSAVKSLKVLQKRIEMTQQARLVLGRMVRELASGFHPYGMYGETGARTPKPWLVIQAAASGGEEISFTGNLYQTKEMEPQTSASPARADLTEIHYHVAASSGQTHLYRRQDEGNLALIGGNYWAGGGSNNDVIIAQYVRSLEFTAWDKDGLPASGSSTYSYTGGELNYPSRVRIKVIFYDKDGLVGDYPFITEVSTMRNTVAGP